MAQNQFAPTPGVSTLEDARDVWNGNAVDAEARLAISEPGSVAESGSSVSLELNTIGKTIVCTNATGTTISPGPTSSAPIGSQWTVVQATENGVIDFVDVSSTGFRFPRFSGEESDGQWATIKIVKVTADDYVCSGDLKVKQPVARFEFGQRFGFLDLASKLILPQREESEAHLRESLRVPAWVARLNF